MIELIFTGYMLMLQTQGNNPYCVAYSVANCASVYGIREDAKKIARNKLYITVEGFGNDLPRLGRHNISYMYYAKTEEISDKLSKGPLLIRVPKGGYVDGILIKNGHHACLVGETETDRVVGGWSKNNGVKGYSLVSKNTTGLMFQDFGTGNLQSKKVKIRKFIDKKN